MHKLKTCFALFLFASAPTGDVFAQTPTNKTQASPRAKPAPAIVPRPAAAPARSNTANRVRAHEMLMEPGQLSQDALRVFVETHITEEMKPRLILMRDILSLNGHSAKRLPPARAAFVITNYKWRIPDDENGRFLEGTLLVFNMDKNIVPWYRTGITVTPFLEWTPRRGGPLQRSTTSGEIYLGNALGAHIWTFATLALLMAGIWMVAGNPVELMRAANGRLSLSQTQMAVWTAAIGGIVYSFGLTKLSVPDIPASLIALMGLSAGTTAASILGPKGDSHEDDKPLPKDRIPASFKHLFTNPLQDGSDGPVLLERAQMSIWTVLMLILFLYKSLHEGIIWEVPWEMVALTGISQASYIVPKQFPRQTDDANPTIAAKVEKPADDSKPGPGTN